MFWMERGEIRLHNETVVALEPYLITRGAPLPVGAVQDEAGVCVTDGDGKVLPTAAKILQRRRDGSVEWMLLDIMVNLGGQEDKSIFIEPRAGEQPAVAHPVTVREEGSLLTLANGLSEIVVSRGGGSLIRRMTINGRTLVEEGMLVDLQVVDGGGKIHRASLSGAYAVTVTHQNRLRTEIKIEGKHAARDGSTFIDFALRLTLKADDPDVKLEHTFYCREEREGKIPIRSMRLIMPTTMDGGAKKLVRQGHHGRDWICRNLEIAENVEIVASSVGDIDNYAQGFTGVGGTHPCAGGSVFIRNMDSLREDWLEYPFHMRPGQQSGFRAGLAIGGVRAVWPTIGWQDDGYTVVTTFEHFRQLHPKAIEIDENVITYSIWPAWSFPMELVRGVSKSHIFWITGAAREMNVDEVMDVQGRWEYDYVEPVDISFDPGWPIFCQGWDCEHFLRYQPEKYPMLENLLEPAEGADNPARHTYDRQSPKGMFHFGCAVNSDATGCNNNADDGTVLAPLEHFLRTGHTYAWDYGKEAGRHYMEVDFCEWSPDPKQDGGLIAHTANHFLGNVYPSHQWNEGLLLYYYLSGDERARKVVVRVGDNNVYWVNNELECVTLDGREAGMAMVNLTAAYRLTREEKYIEAAKRIVENFVIKYEKEYGGFKYPYPQSTYKHPQKLITGYGDWSTFAGLYRMWEQTGEDELRELAVRHLRAAIVPGSFPLNDYRGLDFFSAWILGVLGGDMEDAVERVQRAIPTLLRTGGIAVRRLHFLKEMDERGLIDEEQVGVSG